MCIIAIKPKGIPMFSEKTIRNMANRNKDGGGYMYYDANTKKVVVKKGFMNVDELLTDLKSKDFTDTNFVLHLRIGTSGLKDGLNCHPYPIYDDNAIECETDLAMAHNGILSDYNPGYQSKINDTQNFIQIVLSKLKTGFHKDEDKKLLIEQIIGTNKFCFLDSDNEITTFGKFIIDGDYQYSNTSYQDPVVPKYHNGMISLFDQPYFRQLMKEDLELYKDDDWKFTPGWTYSGNDHKYEWDDYSDYEYELLTFKSEDEMDRFLSKLEQLDDDYFCDKDYFYEVDRHRLAIEKTNA